VLVSRGFPLFVIFGRTNCRIARVSFSGNSLICYFWKNELSDSTCQYLVDFPYLSFLEERTVGEHATNNFGPMSPLSLDTPPSDFPPFMISTSFLLPLFFDGSHFFGFPRAEKKKSNAILFYLLFWPTPFDCRG